MSLLGRKITDSERDALNVKSTQGSRLTGTVQENKNVFDRLVEFFVERYNLLVGDMAEAQIEFPVLQNLVDGVAELETRVETAESIRTTSEEDRVESETGRIRMETARSTAETARENQEGERTSAETVRVDQETDRSLAETVRRNAEYARIGSEVDRERSEESRRTAETIRKTTEIGRSSAESLRSAAETARAAAEGIRKADADALKVWEVYAPDRYYAPLNKVSYDGSSYVCTASCTGIAPDNGAYWLMIAGKGQDGVIVDLQSGTFAMQMDSSGHLIASVNDNDPVPPLKLMPDGHLIYVIS